MNRSLLGIGRALLPIPQALWQRQVKRGSVAAGKNLSFMGIDHHRVRDFVVLELPRRGEPLSPLSIAESLSLALDRVVTILDELEAHLTFLFRNENGDVVWAYPVTIEPTPHKVLFSSGEQIYAA
jgi:hypothetical protein